MANQLIPAPDLAAPSVKHLPFEKRIQLWAELVDACEAFLRAGLRSRIGPQGDLQAAYRHWYARTMEEHERRKSSSWRTCLVGRVPVATEAALAVLDLVWRVLVPLGHPLAVMGGISLATWNHIRATRDVDLLISVDRPAVDPLLDLLRSHGCRPKKSPPVLAVGEHHFVQLLYTPPGEFYDVQFDLLLAESELQRSALARRVRREVPGISRPVDVLHCDDLILFKLVAGRVIDRADAASLLRESGRDRLRLSSVLGGTTGSGSRFSRDLGRGVSGRRFAPA